MQNSDHCAECQSFLLLCSRHILIFLDITKNHLPLDASERAELRMSRCIIFMQPQYIHFLRYHEKFLTVGSVLMSRIQITFSMAKYIFIQPPYINCFKILRKIVYSWKRLDEQNSYHSSECQNVFCIQSPYIYIFIYISANSLSLEAYWRSTRIDVQKSGHFSDCRSVLFGDSSVVPSWTVDQEVCKFESHQRRNLIFVVRSLSAFTQPFGKMSTGFCWPPPYINFLRYNERIYTVRSVLTSRIQITLQNVDV